jgi:hypothetical protein
MRRTQHEQKAWALYLHGVRRLHPARYDEVEPWLWAQLQRALAEAKPKREKVTA